jgi:hypothetical protein
MAERGETYAQVRVFRDIERIPGMNAAQYRGAEVIRRATQRHWNANLVETLKQQFKPETIVQRRLFRYPVLWRKRHKQFASLGNSLSA